MKRSIILAAMLLTACANTSGENFTKPDVSPSAKAADVDYCQEYAEANGQLQTLGGLAGLAQVIGQKRSNFNMCMMDRGYRKKAG